MTSPSSSSSLPQLVIHDRALSQIRRGHRWVFSNDRKSVDPSVKSGDEVAVVTSKGELIGSATYNKQALVTARLYSKQEVALDEEFLGTQLKNAAARREGIASERMAYRMVNGETDNLPGLNLDRYGDVMVVQFLTLAMEKRRDLIIGLIRDLFKPQCLVERSDDPARKFEGLELKKEVLFGELPELLVVNLNGVLMKVNPMDGDRTGLYLDRVALWHEVAKLAPGKKVLDLFCHVGGFGLHAAKAGAEYVRCIDNNDYAVAEVVLNMARNEFEGKLRGKISEAFNYLKALPEEFDLIICDPPAFAWSKKQVNAAFRQYKEINLGAMKLLRPGGMLVTCSSSPATNKKEFEKALGLAETTSELKFERLPISEQPMDHAPVSGMPETNTLKVRLLQRT